MTDLEKAEKLLEKTGVSYTEAKEALDNSDGSLLDALVYLEKQGKVETPPGGGFYSGADPSDKRKHESDKRKNYAREGEGFSSLMKRFGHFCLYVLDKGMKNHLVAKKNEEHLFSVPAIIFVLLLIIFFYITLPALIISLFCGVRYRFEGPDLERESVNKVMDTASDLVDDVKKSFAEDDENKTTAKKSKDDDVCYK